MNQIEDYLAGFKATNLKDLDSIKLLKRYDRKFIFHRDRLSSVFDYLYKDYKVLEIDKNRSFRYQNLYYDTDDYFFYHQHHNRKLNRYKVRFRRYVDSNQCYFEIKFKSNKDKTIKSRLLLEDNDINHGLSDELKEFAKDIILLRYDNIIDRISPKLWIEFDRITLANQINKERLTFDINLTYTDRVAHSQKISNLVIAELKSEDLSPNSPYYQHLKNLKILPSTFSKYCMGIAITKKDIKSNRFKEKLLKLKTYM